MNLLTEISPIRLLLIDDDPSERLACRRALEQSGQGFAICEAETAEQGLRLAKTEHFDCLVLDHDLPDLNGLEFLAELGEDPAALAVPVVMLSRASDPTATMRALKLGATDCVLKDPAREFLGGLPALIVRGLREWQTFQEKQAAVAQLRATEAKYRGLVEQVPAITYIASIEEPGKLLYISPQAEGLGYSRAAWLDTAEGLLTWVHPQDREHVIEQFAATYEHHGPLHCEYRLIRHDGQPRWFLDEAHMVHDEDGRALFLQGLLTDITAAKDMERELAQYRRCLAEAVAQGAAQADTRGAAPGPHGRIDLAARAREQAEPSSPEAYFRQLLESAGEGIFGLNADGRCTFVNPAALDLFGVDSETVLDHALAAILARHRLDGGLRAEGEGALRRTLDEGVPSRFTETLLRREGGAFTAEFSIQPLRSEAGITGAVVVMRDVSEVRALTEKLSYEASHDALTGLFNRVEFERRVGKLLLAARQDDSEHVLCFLDLDRFKAVNDTCGHAAGDQLLRTLGALMESRLRQSDILARLGGDEFGLLLEHCPLEQGWVIANELREAAHGFRFPWAGEEFSVGMSIGIVTLNAASGDVASVLSAADTACYIAKKRGRDRVHVLEVPDSEPFGAPKSPVQEIAGAMAEAEPPQPPLLMSGGARGLARAKV